MKIGDTLSGFQLKKEKYIPDVKSVSRVFEHKESGARLLHLENDDDNKVFSIAFKTPSHDDTGLPHILEHSVLCGSKNFPTKDPFLEMMKGSLHTFLNAMTYPDKTVYPVASKNEKDFFNLMSVYLDAVFFPRIHEKEEIFMQEGWRYHLEGKKDDLKLNGVVYNEMKGFYSSPEALLEDKSMASLYSDTSYAYSSGGTPEAIPKLRYKDFLKFHKKYYHPSNSYIYLYGSGDIKKQLEFLDEKYLSNFKKKEVDISLGEQEPFEKLKRVKSKYSISKDESSDNKTYFALNYALPSDISREERLALGILVYYLMKTKSAPLKKRILQEKIGEDVFGHFEDDLLYPYITFCLKNTSVEKEKDFFKILDSNLKKFSEQGLDKNLLEACLNIFEFQIKEADYGSSPKGLFYNLILLKTWLYGKDPLEFLEYEGIFKKLRGLLKEGYFEKILEKYFVKNTHRSFIILQPEQGLLEKKEKRLNEKLADFKNSLGEKELNDLVKKTLDFKKYQDSPDSVDDIAKIPKLKIEDVGKEVERISTEMKEEEGVTFLFNPLNTKDICYVNLCFDTRVIPLENLHQFNILLYLFGRVGTEKYKYDELDIFVQKYMGGFSFEGKNFSFEGDDSNYLPKLFVKGKSFVRNNSKMLEILFEIMLGSKFDDKEHVRELILEMKSRIEMQIDHRGDVFASTRLLSYFSESGRYNEYVGGVTYYHYICDLVENFDEKWNSLKKDLEFLQSVVFRNSGLLVNVVCEDGNYFDLKNEILKKVASLEFGDFDENVYKFERGVVNEGFLTKSSVQYVSAGGNFKSQGYEYSGKLLVLKNIIAEEYLWDMLRVKGGAYGASCSLGRNGNFVLSSFRDPELFKTLEVYEGMGKFLKGFKSENMAKYIIGTIGALDTPLTSRMKGEKVLSMYISGINDDDLQRERDEVLSTSVDDVKGFSDLVGSLFKEKYRCVFGSESEIMRNKALFGDLKPLHKRA